MIPARILGTASALPKQCFTTEQVVAQTTSERTAEEIKAKTGIDRRHWAEPGDRAADLGAEALRAALERAGIEATDLRRLIFVTSTGGDQLLPATSNIVMKELGLAGTCDCFDMNNACMGFVTALDIAARSVATGLGPVAVVCVQFLSRYIRKEDARPYVVFGDAAAAAIVGPSTGSEGILGVTLANDPMQGGSIWLSHPALTGNADEALTFRASNKNMGKIALGALIQSAHDILDEAQMTVDDIDRFVPHQPNGRMLDRTLEGLGIPEDKIVRVVHEIGSVGAAAMGVSFDRLMRTRPVKPGDTILFAGVGTGIAYGAMLYRT
jgi:3-oxoacyl-[acyl-carrier-protein] synthase-3